MNYVAQWHEKPYFTLYALRSKSGCLHRFNWVIGIRFVVIAKQHQVVEIAGFVVPFHRKAVAIRSAAVSFAEKWKINSMGFLRRAHSIVVPTFYLSTLSSSSIAVIAL